MDNSKEIITDRNGKHITVGCWVEHITNYRSGKRMGLHVGQVKRITRRRACSNSFLIYFVDCKHYIEWLRMFQTSEHNIAWRLLDRGAWRVMPEEEVVARLL
jgi:hypothetical protein